jgi:hypothetical protein
MEIIEPSEIFEEPTPRINLSTAEDIRREMGRVYREARGGKIPTNEATKLTYVLTQILRATEVYLLEQRLSELELTHSGGSK